jgi:co-chaperonin GroES (HSP10)
MTLRATQDCLIVEPEVEKHALLQLLRAKQTGFGAVLAVGPDAKDVKVGDRICFGEFVGQEFTFDKHDYLVMREDHVLGVVEQ